MHGVAEPEKNPTRSETIPSGNAAGENAMIYRRDTHNRSLDDYTEAKPRTGQKAPRRSERQARPDSASAIPQSQPALAAAGALK